MKWTYYIDDEEIAHFRVVDTNYRQELYAMDHPEKVVNIHFQGPQGYDDLTPDGTVWIQWIKGQWQHVTIPGYGVVYGRAGQEAIYVDCSDPESDCIVEWIKDVGLNHFDEEGTQTICDYLRP